MTSIVYRCPTGSTYQSFYHNDNISIEVVLDFECINFGKNYTSYNILYFVSNTLDNSEFIEEFNNLNIDDIITEPIVRKRRCILDNKRNCRSIIEIPDDLQEWWNSVGKYVDIEDLY